MNYDLLKAICKQQNTSITATLAKAGLSTSLGNQLNFNRTLYVLNDCVCLVKYEKSRE